MNSYESASSNPFQSPSGARLHSKQSTPWLCHCAWEGVVQWHGASLAFRYWKGKLQSSRPVLTLLQTRGNSLRGKEIWALKANSNCQFAGFPPWQVTARSRALCRPSIGHRTECSTPGSAQHLILKQTALIQWLPNVLPTLFPNNGDPQMLIQASVLKLF